MTPRDDMIPSRRDRVSDEPSIHDLLTRITVLEKDVERLNKSHSDILDKIEALGDKIVKQVKETVQQEIQLHTLNCPSARNKENSPDNSFQQLVIKHLLSIILGIIAVVATVAGYFK